MKRNPSIVSRVEQYEYKRGINYLKTDGNLFMALKILLVIFFIWAMATNLLSVLSWGMRIGHDSFKSVANDFYTLLFCSILTIVGFVLAFTKIKIVGTIVSIFTSVFTVISFSHLLEDGTGILGYKTIYFTRHFIPHAMIVIISILMIVVIVTEFIKFNASYKKIEKNLYDDFIKTNPIETSDIAWEEYLNNIE